MHREVDLFRSRDYILPYVIGILSSALVHLLLFFLFLLAAVQRPNVLADAMLVDLVEGDSLGERFPPGGMALEPSSVPPAVRQVESYLEMPQALPVRAESLSKNSAIIELVPEKKRQKPQPLSEQPGKADSSEADPQPASQAASDGPVRGQGHAGPGGAVRGGVHGLDGGLDAAYRTRLAKWIDRFKEYPETARRQRLEGQALLRVRIAADGSVLSQHLERSSGHAVLDEGAMKIVRRANPFPALPDSSGAGSLELLLPITFRLR